MNRKHLTQMTKRLVAADQGWKCNLCKELLPACFEVDHIVPLWAYREQRIQGDPNREENLQALCPNCHSLKTYRENNQRLIKKQKQSLKPKKLASSRHCFLCNDIYSCYFPHHCQKN